MERRGGERYRVWFPVTVTTEGGEEGTAITYDVSTEGLLLACPGALPVGARVTLRFEIAEDPAGPREVRASVVRVEDNPVAADGPWRYRLALAFESSQPELEQLLEAQGDD